MRENRASEAAWCGDETVVDDSSSDLQCDQHNSIVDVILKNYFFPDFVLVIYIRTSQTQMREVDGPVVERANLHVQPTRHHGSHQCSD